MITKTFICDECKSSVGEKELYSFDVDLKGHNQPRYSPSYISIKKDICKKCLEKRGVLTELSDEDREAKEEALKKNTKCVEDKLIEILEDLGVAFQD